jgi:hypothetical protein
MNMTSVSSTAQPRELPMADRLRPLGFVESRRSSAKADSWWPNARRING